VWLLSPLTGLNSKGLGEKMARARRASTGGSATSARTRKSSTKSRASSARSNGTSNGASATTLTCPECGKAFTRAASLGAHRNRAHGVAGASSRAQSTRKRRGSATGTTRRSAGRPQAGTQQGGRPRGSGGSQGGNEVSVNRDALLQALFPNGVPAREEVIRRANAWLDEAEQLARSK
jgi:uncharacterized C2H2 Zn-finger protein